MYVPKFLTEVQPGVFERVEKNQQAAITEIGVTKESIQGEKGIFEGLKSLISEVLQLAYDKIITIGGCTPIMGIVLCSPKEVKVVSEIADLVKLIDSDIKEVFESEIKIDYQKKVLVPYRVGKKNDSLITFVHFLDRCQSWDEICAWLKAQWNDILIYGPNIESCNDENHWHFKNESHNVFFTASAIIEKAKEYGFEGTAVNYFDDSLIYLKKV
jgi:hypothetical protein